MTSGIAFTTAVLASVLITYGTTGNPGLALIPVAAWLLLCFAWRHREAITRNRAAIARVAGVLAIPPAAMGLTLLLLSGQLLAFLGAAVFLIACWLAWEAVRHRKAQLEAHHPSRHTCGLTEQERRAWLSILIADMDEMEQREAVVIAEWDRERGQQR